MEVDTLHAAERCAAAADTRRAVGVGEGFHYVVAACLIAMRKPHHGLGQTHVVEHPHKLYVPAARVTETVDEEARRTDIVNPHPLTAVMQPAFTYHLLHGTPRNQKFLKHTRIQFVKGIDAPQLFSLLG